MNKTIIIGRLTRDAELRYAQSGTAVTMFTVAVDRKMSKEKKQQAEAQNQPTADFISCKAFGKTGELIANYFNKGQQIALEGHIQTGSYEKDGRRIYTTDVIVDAFDFLDSGNNQQNNAGGNQAFGSQNDMQGFFPVESGDMPF